MNITAVQRRTLADLLDAGDGRPFPFDLCATLVQTIEARVTQLLPLPATTLNLSKEPLNNRDRCEGLFDATLKGEAPPFVHTEASAAGTLAHRAIEMDVAVGEDLAVHDVVERAAGRLGRDRRFVGFWDRLDGPARAELQMQAVRSVEQFRASFPPIRAFRRALAPVTELWLEHAFAGGTVRVRGKVDLLLNAARAGRATRVLIDFKGGRAWSEHIEDMRLYALLHTLRCGVPPYRVATFFLASGEWQAEDVSEQTLAHAADRVVAAVRTAAMLLRGDGPRLTPGPYCRRCPRRFECPAAARAERPAAETPASSRRGSRDEPGVATAR